MGEEKKQKQKNVKIIKNSKCYNTQNLKKSKNQNVTKLKFKMLQLKISKYDKPLKLKMFFFQTLKNNFVT